MLNPQKPPDEHSKGPRARCFPPFAKGAAIAPQKVRNLAGGGRPPSLESFMGIAIRWPANRMACK